MLREVGKRDVQVEKAFLKQYYRHMPRTMLRYAIERFPAAERQPYLKGTAQVKCSTRDRQVGDAVAQASEVCVKTGFAAQRRGHGMPCPYMQTETQPSIGLLNRGLA